MGQSPLEGEVAARAADAGGEGVAQTVKPEVGHPRLGQRRSQGPAPAAWRARAARPRLPGHGAGEGSPGLAARLGAGASQGGDRQQIDGQALRRARAGVALQPVPRCGDLALLQPAEAEGRDGWPCGDSPRS